MNSFFEEQLESLDLHLNSGEPQKEDQDYYRQSSIRIKEAIDRINAFLSTYLFPERADEISFYKDYAPQFYSQYLFFSKVSRLKADQAFQEPEVFLKQLRFQIGAIDHFNMQHPDFIRHYFQKTMTGYDHLFLREKKTDWPCDELFLLQNNDLPIGSHWIAEIKANQYLRPWLSRQIQQAVSPEMPVSSRTALAWKGTKTDLIELLYALYMDSSFGEMTFKQLNETAEQLFGVRLNNAHQMVQELFNRKAGTTLFLDRLKKRYAERPL